jgi:Fe-S-cluster formation regulator IscX/YfhJ
MRDSSTGATSGVGLASRDPKHPHFTAISWVVLQEIKTDVAGALLRLEILRREQPHPAIVRATEMLRLAIADLDGFADDQTTEHEAPTG